MSESRYFWLKLQDGFFNQKSMKKLRKMDRGEFCTIVYLKMQLETLRKGGLLTFDGVEDSFEDEIALQIDEDADDVKKTIEFLEKNKLLIRLSQQESYLPEAVENTGAEGASAKRMRELREREHLLSSQCDGRASLCYGEKIREDKTREEESREEEIKKEIDQDEYDGGAEDRGGVGEEGTEKPETSKTSENNRNNQNAKKQAEQAEQAEDTSTAAVDENDIRFEDMRRQRMNDVLKWGT